MSTTYMNLDLPTPSITLGPQWAEDVNDAFELVDEHDHSTGKGVKVKPNGMNINDDLDIQEHTLENVEAVELTSLGATLTGVANVLKVHSYNGDLYFTNSSGTAVQITSGGTIVSNPGSAQLFETQAVSTDITISPSDTFVYLIVNTSAARIITLPLASGLTSGRIYVIKDATGQADTNAISIVTQGSDLIDGASSVSMDMEYGTYYVVCDGSSKYYLS